jgi:hypothetical protein
MPRLYQASGSSGFEGHGALEAFDRLGGAVLHQQQVRAVEPGVGQCVVQARARA